jgi:hypothetical protein
MKSQQKHVDAVDDIWKQYTDRKITLDKTHELVRQYVKGLLKRWQPIRRPRPQAR